MLPSRSALAILAFVVVASASGQTLQDNLWITNGPVDAIEQAGNTVYLGGAFSRVGPSTGNGAALDLSSAQYDPGLPKVDGIILSVVADGSGGWFLGGLFTSVGGFPRRNMAHILPDKSLDQGWRPDPDSAVYTMALSGSVLYVGGMFGNIGGIKRQRIAAVSAANGSTTGWDPGADALVLALAVSGQYVYAGGYFDIIGGQPSAYLAEIDAVTGNATQWGLAIDGYVAALAPNGTTMYIGGAFNTINGQTHTGLGEILLTDPGPTNWSPIANGLVRDIAVSGNVIYVAGDFSTINRLSRNFIAAIDPQGAVLSWNPLVNNLVTDVLISGQTAYLCGAFTTVNSQSRIGLAAVSTLSGQTTPWNPSPNTIVYKMAIAGNTMYAGGFFTSMNTVARRNLAALDATTGVATSWNPGTNNAVRDILVSGNTVYVCGDFDSLGGQRRPFIGSVDASSGSATSWTPAVAGFGVYTMGISGSALLFGGEFSRVGIQSRNNIAAVNLSDGVPTGWNPNAAGTVNTLAISGGTVYLGGQFSQLGTQTRMYLGAVDEVSGTVQAWSPMADNLVNALLVDGNTVIAGGSFFTIGNQSSPHLAAIDAVSGNAVGLNLDIGGTFDETTTVSALALAGRTLYVGGNFTNVLSSQRRGIFSVDLATENVTPWDPQADEPVLALFASPPVVYAGGNFFRMLGDIRTGFAGIIDESVLPSVTVLSPNGGESWPVGSTRTIQWNSTNIPGDVRIELSRDGGSSFSDLASTALNTGSFSWDVTGPASQAGIIRISDAGSPAVNDLSDAPFAITQSAIAIEPSSLNFGSVPVGTTSTDSVLVQNVGTDTLRIFSAVSDNPDFTVTPGSATLLPSTARVFRIGFTPSSPGISTAGIVLTHDAPGGTDTIRVSGTGSVAGIAINPTTIDFGTVPVGLSRTDSVTIQNDGNDTLRVFSVVSDNPDFAVTPGSATIAPSSSRVVQVVFTPASAGLSNGEIVLTHDAPGGTDTIRVSGTGVVAGLSFAPTSLPFGDLFIGSRVSAEVTLRNTGGAPLTIDSVTLRGPDASAFNLQGAPVPSTVLSPGDSTSFVAEFFPQSAGPKNAVVRLYSNAPTSPDSIGLSGNALISQIQPQLTGDTVAGVPLDIKVILVDFVVLTDSLYYRNGGETQYRRTNFVQNGDTLIAVFPDSVMNIRGVEYFIRVTGQSGQVLTFPQLNPALNPAIIRVRVNNYPSPRSSRSGKYTMISAPLELEDGSTETNLFDDLGEYRRNLWRLFHWDGMENIEYPSPEVSFESGSSLWLITHAQQQFDVSEGLSTNSARPFSVILQPGWNQIANPFAFPVARDSVVRRPEVVGPYYFDGNEYLAGGFAILPWEGYFVRNDLPTPVAIDFPPVEAPPTLLRPADFQPSDVYRVQISATIAGIDVFDTQNYLGFARDGKIEVNYPDPPAVDDRLQVSLLQDGQAYMTDFRRQEGEGQRWDAEVRSSLPSTDITMSIVETGPLPDGFRLYVFDSDEQRAISTGGSRFVVHGAHTGEIRHLTFVVGTDSYARSTMNGIPLLPVEYALEQNYPNPFNPTTTIRYTLARRGVVSLELYNLLGQRVRTLVHQEEGTGVHTVTWDGTNDAGRSVSSGVYLYTLRSGDFVRSRKLLLMR
jgi:hypothetical protein